MEELSKEAQTRAWGALSTVGGLTLLLFAWLTAGWYGPTARVCNAVGGNTDNLQHPVSTGPKCVIASTVHDNHLVGIVYILSLMAIVIGVVAFFWAHDPEIRDATGATSEFPDNQ